MIEVLGADLSTSIGLQVGQQPEQFEEIIGTFLSWTGDLHITERFLRTGNHPAGSNNDQVTEWLRRARETGDRCRNALLETLYRLFSARAVDRDRAASAYQKLIGALFGRHSIGEGEWIVFATTNYDPSIELALKDLNYGFHLGVEADGITTPILNPTGLAKRARSDFYPVLHLHGAVGWYRRNGRVEVQGSDQLYNPSLGEEPALLLPDPAKDPDKAAGVQALWREFEEALRGASHVLVAGHSLHDRHLIDAVRRAMERGASVGVTTLWTDDGDETANRQTEVLSQLNNATVIPARLGPDLRINEQAVLNWRWRAPMLRTTAKDGADSPAG